MADGRLTLDIEQKQVLVFFDDPNYNWHHRVLVCPLKVEGNWVALSPDLECEAIDLRGLRVIPLRRRAVFPDRVRGNVYIFDEVDEADWRASVAEASELARVLGAQPVAQPSGLASHRWRVSDPAVEDFGEELDSTDTVEGDSFVARDTVGLWHSLRSDGSRTWVAVELVAEARKDLWLDQKRSGPGRDIRISSAERDASGRRYATLARSLAVTRPSTQKDWPFRGPAAGLEFFEGVRNAGQELATFDGFWSQRSGIAKGSALAHSHRNILTALSLFQSYDQLDLHNVAGLEFLSRWCLMIHAAVRRNAKAPSFQGLESYLSHSFDESGGIITSNFAKFVAAEQKDEAQIMKNQRQLREEADATEKNKKKKKDGEGE